MRDKKFTLNEEQKRFIATTDASVLVSASAGSGKTTTMIEKILDLIHNGASIDEIMAVTFTNAAANDMRQKLFNKLLDEMQKTSGAEKERLSDELDKINTSDIGTLHSVCKKIITKYYYAIDLNPEFSVASEGVVSNLMDTAIGNVVKNINTTGEEKFYSLFESFNGKRNLNGLYSAVISIISFLESISQPTDWIQSKKKNINMYFDYIYGSNIAQIKGIITEISAGLKRAQNLDIELLVDFFGRTYNVFTQLSESKNFEELSKVIFSAEIPDIPNRKKGLEGVLDIIADARMFRKKIVGILTELRANCVMKDFSLLKKVSEQNEKIKDLLVEFILEVKEEYGKLKSEKRLLDFNDLENFTYKILQNPEVVLEIKNKYKYIFVDEYQDINDKQDSIIFSIAKEYNVFLIGDVKQCIYAFRQSTPEIFLKKYHDYPVQKGKGAKKEIISLNENYRSEPEILSFANDIFDELITEQTVGVNYKKDARFISDKKPASASYPKVRMLLLDKKVEDGDSEKNMLASESYDIESDIVINEVSQLIQNGKYVTSDGEEKQINYGDIAILLRDQVENARAMYDAFIRAGIPVVTKIKEAIFDCPEVLQLYSFLKVLDNSFDDYSLATVLLSPVGGLNENELAEIRLKSADRKSFFYEIIQKNDKAPKIKAFLKTLAEYRFKAMQLTVKELIEGLLEEYNFINIWRSKSGGLGTVTKVQEFIKLIQNCPDKYSLKSVLDYLELQKDGEKQRMQLGSNENAVKIMSIHDSKGLEFPVVFLCNVGKAFNRKTLADNLIISREVGLGIKSFDTNTRRVYDTVQRRACLLSKKKEEMDEQIRLLYVAITRAKCALRIVGTYDFKGLGENGEKVDKSVYACSNFLEFILRSLPKSDLRRFANKSSGFELKNGCKVSILSNIQKEEMAENKIIVSAGNKNLEEQLKKCYRFKYVESPKVATKNSVTALLKEESDYTQNCETVKSFEISNRDNFSMTSQNTGTLYHKIMERMNYTESDEEIKKIIAEETNKNFEEIEPIKFEEIKSAVEIIGRFAKGKKVIKESQFIMRDEYKNLITTSNINEKVMVQGVVDLIIIDGEKAQIIDFKTNKNKTEEELKQTYKLQLDLYSLAVKRGFNKPYVEEFIYSFVLGKLIRI